MTNKMKFFTLIIGLLLYSNNTLANGFYGGLSFQKSGYDFEKPEDNSSNQNPIGYDDIATNLGGFIGYELLQSDFSPYKLSLELSWFNDKNSLHSDEFSSDIKMNMISFNTIHHHYINERVSFIGILGANYANFEFDEYSIESDYSATDKESGYGANIGLGINFLLPEIQHLNFMNKVSLRMKVVYSAFKDINPEINSIQQIDGITSISLDLKYDF